MSAEHPPVDGAVDLLEDNSRGFDPLNRVDRGAMAVYSGNSRFLEGTELRDAHPLTQAMTVIYAMEHPRADFPPKKSPLEVLGVDEALLCVGELRRSVARASQPELVIRADNVMTALRTKEPAGSGQAAGARAPARLGTGIPLLAEAGFAGQKDDQAAERARERAAAEEALRERWESRRRQFRQHVSDLQEQTPGLDFEGYLTLGEKLQVEEEDGGLAVKETGSFQAEVVKRVSAYMEEPAVLVNDLQVMMLVGGGSLRSSGSRAAGSEEAMYAEGIFASVAGQLLKSRYTPQALESEIITKWLELGSGLPSPMPANAAQELEEFLGAGNKNFSANELATLFGRRILVNSLRDIVTDNPKYFINRAYLLAQAGLQPHDRSRLKVTVSILQRCLADQKRAGHILYLSTGAKNKMIQRRAIDLMATLSKLDVPGTLLLGSKDLATEPGFFDPAPKTDIVLDDTLPNQLYPTVFVSGGGNYRVRRAGQPAVRHAREAQAHTDARTLTLPGKEAFWTYVHTPAGRQNTLYGRFLAYNEAEERAAAKLALSRPAVSRRPGLLSRLRGGRR